MRTVHMLRESAIDEAHSANEYAMCALEYRSNDPELARFFHELSETEFDHSQRFLEHLDRKVSDMRSSGIELDQEFDDWLADARKCILVNRERAKRLISMYR